MKYRKLLKILSIVFLLIFAVLLYADLQFIHQLYPITDAMIASAPDDATRRALTASRHQRERRLRMHKAAVQALLVVDVALLIYLGATLWRPSNRPRGGQDLAQS